MVVLIIIALTIIFLLIMIGSDLGQQLRDGQDGRR